MPPKKWKFPCVKCGSCVRKDQKFVNCHICKRRVHFKCSELTKDQFFSIKKCKSRFTCNECESPAPCLKCNDPVCYNDKALQCNGCNKWVHFTCTELTEAQFNILEVDEDSPYYCSLCKPSPYPSLDDSPIENNPLRLNELCSDQLM